MSPTIRSGLVAGLAQRVGSAVDADQHRPVVADVGPERREVLLVVVAADDDQRVPPLDRRRDVGHAHAVEQERALPLHVLHRVRGERLELGGQARPRLGHRPGHGLGVLHLRPRRRTVPSSASSVSPSTRTRAPSLIRANTSLPTSSIRAMPARDQDLGPEVGIAAGDARRGVDHRRDAGSRPARRRSPGRGRRGRSTAMSPGRSRLVRFFVRRSRRAVPPHAGSAAPRCAAAPHGADAHGADAARRCLSGQHDRRASATVAVTQRARHHVADRHAGGAGERASRPAVTGCH